LILFPDQAASHAQIDTFCSDCTSEQNSPWAGSRTGDGYSIQGNSLTALTGDAAGGQTAGRESAALMVKTTAGWPIDIDLRVDDAPDPIAELDRLFNMYTARQQIIASRRAARNGQVEIAKSLLVDAVQQVPIGFASYCRPRISHWTSDNPISLSIT
jgi:uncharacterized Ntn-hydrolase superfamily protein